MKKSKRIILAIAPVLGATLACGGSDSPQERDVYTTKEECVKDWSEGDLCEKMDENDERSYHGNNHGYFWGPVYYRGSRSVNYNGRTITGANTGTAKKPFSLSSSSSKASRSSKSSPSYSGFSGSRSSGPSSSS